MPDDFDDDSVDDLVSSRTKTLDDNPSLTCTVEQLAFVAWQKAAGDSSLIENGSSWDRFSAWWRAHATRYSTIRDVCAMAWAESSAHELEKWWRSVVTSQPFRY